MGTMWSSYVAASEHTWSALPTPGERTQLSWQRFCGSSDIDVGRVDVVAAHASARTTFHQVVRCGDPRPIAGLLAALAPLSSKLAKDKTRRVVLV